MKNKVYIRDSKNIYYFYSCSVCNETYRKGAYASKHIVSKHDGHAVVEEIVQHFETNPDGTRRLVV